MRPLLRIVLSVLVLAFAAGTFVQAAAPAQAKMEMPMAMSQIGGDHMSGCDDCMDDPGDMACFIACTFPALALVSPLPALAPVVRMPMQPAFARAVVGEPRSPDPYPPKPSIRN
jgi:hypothetical protein